MRTILLLACFVAGVYSHPVAAQADAGALQRLAWLVGDWTRTDLPEGRTGHEQWRFDGSRYVGVGVMLDGDRKAFEEKLSIDADPNGVYYVAEVPGNASPVRFRLVEQAENIAVFENAAHDFPKRIAYRADADRLEARISGNGREAAFRFERAPSTDGSVQVPVPADKRPAMHNLINWFEIPAVDFDRAVRFYSAVLDARLEPMDLGGTKMGMFPNDGSNVSGAVVQGADYVPGAQGALVYLSGGEDLSPMLARVAQAGGTVIVPKTQISPEFGYFALFFDTEGNKVGLHSPK